MFRLYVDPSVVVGGGVAVEQSPFSFRSSRGVFVVVVSHNFVYPIPYRRYKLVP